MDNFSNISNYIKYLKEKTDSLTDSRERVIFLIIIQGSEEVA